MKRYLFTSSLYPCMLAVSMAAGLSARDASANPQGGQVSAGSAAISGQGTAAVQVNQASDRAVIDWQSFNIAPGETTAFHQPSASSAILNRIHDQNPSQILGNLSANGQVALVNPNGMVFEKGSRVDVAGLVATSADISNERFMQGGALAFDRPGRSEARILSEGTIAAKEAGLVALVAPHVMNSGVITAKAGRVTLGSGDTVTLDLYGDGLVSVAVSGDITSQLVENSGHIAAEGGTVALTAAAAREVVDSLIVHTGVIEATALGERQGTITLSAEGSNAIAGNRAEDKGRKQGSATVLVQGVLDASGRHKGERGGTITVTGDNVALLDGTLLDASGYEGQSGTTAGKAVSAVRDGAAGGDIRIGGDYMGQGDTPTAKNLYVDPGALVLNDALHAGDAGRTIFWSDGDTAFYGNVYARALGGNPVDGRTWNAAPGGNPGNGGFVETSGHEHLDAGGYVDLTASHGKRGTYFLDPADITIYGNVDPAFQSTDGTINLSTTLKLWLDGSDTSKVALTYNSLGTTATGTSGANTITVSANTGLAVGTRIRLGGAGAVTAASTLGADTYTVSAIAGTTITLSSNLTSNYAGSTVYQGYVSTWSDKSGQGNDATQSTAANMPLWISNGQNGLGVLQFNGSTNFMSRNAVVFGITDLVSAFLVQNFTGNATSRSAAFAWDKDGSNRLQFHNPYDDTLSWQLGNNGACCGGIGTTATPSGFYNTSNIFSLRWNGANSSDIYYNSQNLVTGTGGASFNGNESITLLVGKDIFNNYTIGTMPELVLYNAALSTNARNLVEQYQSAKWGIALTPPGTGATEVAKATASDGYSVFTTRYLERLAQSADVSLQATNDITLDLAGDTLALASGRSLTITAGNDIVSDAAGAITVAGTGNITLAATHDITLAHDFDLSATGSGGVTLRADNSIVYSGAGDITTQGGAITLNADWDASTAGAISLGSGTTLTSNGGNITLGGGATPATVAAYGTASNVQGINLTSATLSALGGNISMRGQGYASSTANGVTTSPHGILLNGATVQTTGTGTLTLNGTGGGTGVGGLDLGIYVYNGSTIAAVNGDVAVTGTGGGGASDNDGVAISGAGTNIIQTTGSGNITVTGTGGGGASSDGVSPNSPTGGVQSVNGNISLAGIAGAGGGSYGLYSPSGSTIGGASHTGSITLTGDTANLSSLTIRTTGNVTFKPNTASTTIGVAGGAGTLGLTSGLLNNITAGSITIGRSDGSGALTANAYNWNAPATLLTGTGGIAINGAQTAGAGSNAAFTFDGPATVNAALDLTNATGGTQAITFDDAAAVNADITTGGGDLVFNDTLSLGADIATGGGDITLADDVTLTAASSIDTGTADIVFTGTIEGTQDFEVTTTGDITFNDDVGAVSRLGNVVLDPRHLTAGGAFNAASFTLTGGTGNVGFSAGTGLNATGDIGIATNGNITGTYAGTNGVLDAGAGTISATVNFSGLDISGAGATLSAGYIGVPDVADQVMANLISIGGVSYPALVPDSDYTFAGFVIGVRPPSGGGGGNSTPPPVQPPVSDPGPAVPPLTPPVMNPDDDPQTPASHTFLEDVPHDISRIQREEEETVSLAGPDRVVEISPGAQGQQDSLYSLSAELLRELRCQSSSAHASCAALLQSR